MLARVGSEPRWIVAEAAGRYRYALGTTPPPGLPDAFLEPVADVVDGLPRRWFGSTSRSWRPRFVLK